MIQYFTAQVNRRSEFEDKTLDGLRAKIVAYYLDGGNCTTAPEADSITVHENDEERQLGDVELDNFNDELDEDFYEGRADGDAQEYHGRWLGSMPGRL